MGYKLSFRRFLLRYFLRAAIIAIMVLSPPLAAISQAKKANISAIFVSNTTPDILVFSKVEGAFTNEIQEAIDSGIPTNFTYYIELKKKTRLWRDEKVAAKIVKHSAKFDALKKEYLFDGTEGDKQVKKSTKEIEELKKWLIELNGVPIIPKESLEPGEKYYVKLKAEIKSIKLVFPLNYLFFFFSFWDFDTSWKNSASFSVKGAQ